MMKRINIWVAISSRGYPAPFLGWAFTRAELTARMMSRAHRGHCLQERGYRAVKAQLVVEAS